MKRKPRERTNERTSHALLARNRNATRYAGGSAWGTAFINENDLEGTLPSVHLSFLFFSSSFFSRGMILFGRKSSSTGLRFDDRGSFVSKLCTLRWEFLKRLILLLLSRFIFATIQIGRVYNNCNNCKNSRERWMKNGLINFVNGKSVTSKFSYSPLCVIVFTEYE